MIGILRPAFESGKVRSVTAKFALALRSILCPYLDSQGIHIYVHTYHVCMCVYIYTHTYPSSLKDMPILREFGRRLEFLDLIGK